MARRTSTPKNRPSGVRTPNSKSLTEALPLAVCSVNSLSLITSVFTSKLCSIMYGRLQIKTVLFHIVRPLVMVCLLVGFYDIIHTEGYND